MEKFELKYHPRAVKDLDALDPYDAKKIIEKAKALQEHPFPQGKVKKKIVGLKQVYRLGVDTRSSSYRVFYTIRANEVVILRIVSKKEADRIIEILREKG